MSDSTTIKKQQFFLDMAKNSKPLHRLAAAFFIILSAAISFIAFENEIAIYILAFLAALPIVFLIPLYPRTWLSSVIIMAPAFYYSSAEGVSAFDIIIGFYYSFFLVIWFLWQLGIKKRKLIKNYADLFVFLFFLFLPLNAVVAFFNGVSPADWIREYALFFITLYYFPLRTYFSSREGLKKLITVILASITIGYGIHFGFYYYFMTKGVEYAYQLGQGVRLSTAMVLTGVLISMPFFFFIKNRKIKISLLILNLIGIAAVITTFARTIWVLLFFSLIILFFVINFRQKIHIVLLGILSTIIITAGAYIYLGDKADLYYKMIEKRITSSTKGKKDISMQSRFNEWEVVVNKILENPIGGNGLFKEFHFYNPITEYTKHTNYIHNGYLYLIYRTGIPLALCYFFFIFIYFYKSFIFTINIKQKDDPLLKAASLGAFLGVLSLILMNMTSAIYTYRDGIFVVIYLISVIGIIEAIKRKEEVKENYGR